MTLGRGKGKSKQPGLFLLLVLFVFLEAGCTTTPTTGTVTSAIINYFEEKNYRVIELDISDIQPVPLREKIYMGTEGYIVGVQSITLEVLENIGEPWSYRKGQRLTFRNGAIQIKEQRGRKGTWVISNISGIPVR